MHVQLCMQRTPDGSVCTLSVRHKYACESFRQHKDEYRRAYERWQSRMTAEVNLSRWNPRGVVLLLYTLALFLHMALLGLHAPHHTRVRGFCWLEYTLFFHYGSDVLAGLAYLWCAGEQGRRWRMVKVWQAYLENPGRYG